MAQFGVHELIDFIEGEGLAGVDKIIHENNDDDYSLDLFRFRFFI